MIAQAQECGDVAAELLANEALEVDLLDDREFRLEIENTVLGWNSQDGWCGPSATADVLAEMVLRERSKAAK